jgi:hypothetical protein
MTTIDGATLWSAVGAIATCIAAVVAILACRASHSASSSPRQAQKPAKQPKAAPSVKPQAKAANPPTKLQPSSGGRTAVVVFKNDDPGYLQWVADNQGGFIVNIDYAHAVPTYPMVHRATHRVVWTDARENYTTEQYYKVCSNDLSALQAWSRDEAGKELTECQMCMKRKDVAEGMQMFTVEGTVPPFQGSEFDLPADNAEELLNFWCSAEIDTGLETKGGRPVIAVTARKFVQKCRPGLKVAYTFKVVERRNGRGIEGVTLQVLS